MSQYHDEYRAHPRACGENLSPFSGIAPRQGSSPRMRGKRKWGCCLAWFLRLIPAHAGKTIADWLNPRRAEAHPRACGENFAAPGPPTKRGGSSPRMRGKRGNLGRQDLRRGLIPAHAGKTAAVRLRATRTAAHPRACGENSGRVPATKASEGSSPRMRGKPRRLAGRRRPRGLIPAHAGKTAGGELVE